MKKNKTTPAMKQYWDIKNNYPESILLFRMGDFYETFDNDAQITSDILGITLTKRANGAASSVPLAGFPYHALDQYIDKLLKAGYRVAICEQVEDPKKAKGIVKREVVEVLSPGTAISEKYLEHNQNNYFASIYIKKGFLGIALLDYSTGDFFGGEWEIKKGLDLIKTYNVREVIMSEKQYELFGGLLSKNSYMVSTYQNWIADHKISYDKIVDKFKLKSLKGFGLEDHSLAVIAAGASIYYIDDNHRDSSDHIQYFQYQGQEDSMHLDPFTIDNLEIFKPTSSHNKKATLIHVIDKTRTSAGARLLKKYLKRPLLDLKTIKSRQNRISEFIKNTDTRLLISDELNEVFDIERIVSRISSEKSNPRDLLNLKTSLENSVNIKQCINSKMPELYKLTKQFQSVSKIIDNIDKTIDDNCSANMLNGGFIKDGYSNELDRVRKLSNNSKQWLVDLQNKEQNNTGITSLKIKYNKVFGYYFEVTKAHTDKVPDYFIRKQTLVNAERYFTQELKDFEDTILSSNDRLIQLEKTIFNDISNYIMKNSKCILENASILSRIDVSVGFADVALKNNYCLPNINDDHEISLKDSRHPVIEQLLSIDDNFISNDVNLNRMSKQIAVITGPNMAGKSTYLRQIALISIMAQIGSYVSAKKASICIIDKVYTRVGASDNLSEGESTFLVEMNETANILNNATSRSLIILDEIGRGTSTYDGLAIAWSIIEYLHNNNKLNPITLFATHYHELVQLANQLDRSFNLNIKVSESDGELVFLRKIIQGGASQSYGVHVARMAGLPIKVINRANVVLKKLAIDKDMSLKCDEIDQLELEFIASNKHRVIDELKEIDIDNMTPFDALSKLMELKEKYDD